MRDNIVKEFLKNFFSWKVAANIVAMIIFAIGLVVIAYFCLGIYTRHGEKVEVPDVVKKDYAAAKKQLDKLGLEVIVADTIYNKRLPANMVMEQTPEAGAMVKSGRFVYVIINAGHSPKKLLPRIVDNSSAREAIAQLNALGFKHVEIQYISGEKEWVYGLKANGKYVTEDPWVSVDARIVLMVGDGTRDLGDSVTYTESPFYYEPEEMQYHNDDEEELDYHEFEYEGVDNKSINDLLNMDELNREN